MSVINKYPFINELLSSLSEQQLTTLASCINGQGAAPIFRTLKSWGSSVLSSSDKGIYPINLEMNGPSAITYQGYLIYTDSDCVLISYANDDACQLTIINITMPASGSDIKWEYVSEKLTINELRSCLFDAAAGEGGGSGTVEYTYVDFVYDPDIKVRLTFNFTDEDVAASIRDINNKIDQVNEARSLQIPHVETLDDMNNCLDYAKQVDPTYVLANQLIAMTYMTFIIANENKIVSKTIIAFPFIFTPVLCEAFDANAQEVITQFRVFYMAYIGGGTNAPQVTNIDFLTANDNTQVRSNK